MEHRELVPHTKWFPDNQCVHEVVEFENQPQIRSLLNNFFIVLSAVPRMKKSILLLVLFLISMSLSGCLDEEEYTDYDDETSTCFAIVQMTRELVTNNSDDYNSSYTITTTTYDTSCRIVEVHVKGDIYRTMSSTTYDEAGNPLKETTLYYDDWGGVESDEPSYIWNTTYMYDEHGLYQTWFHRTEWGESTGTMHQHTNDENGQLVQTTIYGTNVTIHYTYDENGNQLREVYKDDGVETSSTENAYENGLLMNSTSDFSTISYTYDANGKQLTQTKVEHQSGTPTYRNSTYDEQGHLTLIEESTISEYGTWIYTERYVWEAIVTETE